MGLAPYGEPRYVDADPRPARRPPRRRLVHASTCATSTTSAGRRMTNRRFDELFGGPPATPECADHPARVRPRRARSRRSPRRSCCAWPATATTLTGERDAVLAGGVALNCVANGRLLRDGPFDEIWVQPAAGDAGSALGAALCGPGTRCSAARARSSAPPTPCRAPASAPRSTADEIAAELAEHGSPVRRASPTRPSVARRVAELLADGAVVGCSRAAWSSARGPSATARSSPTPRSPEIQRIAEPAGQEPRVVPALRPGRAGRARRASGSTSTRASPYMLLVAPVVAERLRRPPAAAAARRATTAHRVVAEVRSHDPRRHPRRRLGPGADRDAERAPAFHRLLAAFDALHRLPGAGQHLVQRARRADRVHPRRRLPVLHDHRHRLAGARGLPARRRPTSRRGPARPRARARLTRWNHQKLERVLVFSYSPGHGRPRILATGRSRPGAPRAGGSGRHGAHRRRAARPGQPGRQRLPGPGPGAAATPSPCCCPTRSS